MKVAIFGAGAIGGFPCAKLAAANADVPFIARGPRLEAMRRGGGVRHPGRERDAAVPRDANAGAR
jgi:2-dehydropantoate 2-reductase